MTYKKREIDLTPEVDFEFRRIETVEEERKKTIIRKYFSFDDLGAELRIFYTKTASEGETILNLPSSYKPNSVLFYLNGQLMRRGFFYEETSPGQGIITHDPVVEGDWIFVVYYRPVELIWLPIFYSKTASEGETILNLPSSYKPNSVSFYLNGQLMRGGFFYEETDPEQGIITHDPVVENDWIFVVYYRPIEIGELPFFYSKTADEGEVVLRLPTFYKPDSVLFYLNGQLMRRGFFYEETSPGQGIITHDPVVENDWIFVIYLR